MENTTLEYHGSGATKGLLARHFSVMAATLFGCDAAVSVLLLYVVPRFLKKYKIMNARLPAGTTQVIGLSRAYGHFPAVIGVLAMVFGVALLLGFLTARISPEERRKKAFAACIRVAVGLTVLGMLIATIVLLLPLL